MENKGERNVQFRIKRRTKFYSSVGNGVNKKLNECDVYTVDSTASVDVGPARYIFNDIVNIIYITKTEHKRISCDFVSSLFANKDNMWLSGTCSTYKHTHALH